jgi:hypothetical protein
MRLNDPQAPLVPRSVRVGLTLVLSLGWLVPALLAWWLHAMGARSAARIDRPASSFSYDATAVDLSAVAWWWGLVVVLAWTLAGAVYLRRQIQQPRR